MTTPSAQPPADLPKGQEPPPPPVFRSDDLFAGQREIVIEHAGEKYRLRITRRNKLILQK